MKIRQIHFKNLNSLAGEWMIDLTAPEYGAEGIFAIIGPTGAGKSTILDAICLALYGSTPRLGRVTQGGNEIMSRRSGECFAELLFSTGEGSYRCIWSQHRARKSASGQLQPPRHELSDADSGQILESSLRGVATEVERLTGMDFDRFTRSMLLAQGGVAAFLQANADERGPILEQITGTEIYSLISMAVHERQRGERERLNLLQASINGAVLLEPEQERTLEQQLAEQLQEERQIAAILAEIGEGIGWRLRIRELEGELATLSLEEQQLQGEVERFAPERERLERSRRGERLDAKYATLAAIRKGQQDDRQGVTEERGRLPLLEQQLAEQTALLQRSEGEVQVAREELQRMEPLLKKVRQLDRNLAERERLIRDAEQERTRIETVIRGDQGKRVAEQKKLSDSIVTLGKVERYLEDHAGDEWLVSNLTGLAEQLNGALKLKQHLDSSANEQRQAEAELAEAVRLLSICQKKTAASKKQQEELAAGLNQVREQLGQLLDGRLLREYRTEKEHLQQEREYIIRILSLEEQRSHLEDGRPCPLCGATEHPFATGDVPAIAGTDQRLGQVTRLIEQAEQYEAEIKKLENRVQQGSTRLLEAEKEEALAQNRGEQAEKRLQSVKQSLDSSQESFEKVKVAITVKLAQAGLEPDFDKPESLVGRLEAKVANWQRQLAEKLKLERLITSLEGEIRVIDTVIANNRLAVARCQERLQQLTAEFAAEEHERKGLFGDKDPDANELSLKKALADAEKMAKKGKDTCDSFVKKLERSRGVIETLERQIEGRGEELVRVAGEFEQLLKQSGFADEGEFLAARLDLKESERLSARFKQLEDKQIQLAARRTDRAGKLAEELGKELTGKGLDQLEGEQLSYRERLAALQGGIAGIRQRLTDNSRLKGEIMEQQLAIDAQRGECRRWDNLHQLIGSADGKKFRNFAQGLTFEQMVQLANRQLRQMSDRYLLVRDRNQPLELNVIDNYQGGEVRSARNLSGGESFIVSLALALGLSGMASNNVQVDSLFLDEGFGTLDEEALDTALETLSTLQRDGKLIGIISHVAALKERISARIMVTPLSGGKSGLEGPGCRRL